MQFYELSNGDQVNTAAIEAVTVERECEGEWQVWIVTAANRYKDRSHRTEARAIHHRTVIVASLTGEHICRNCATALEPHRQLQGKWVHKLTMDNPDRDGCQTPEPSTLAAEWDTVEDALGEVA